jgi:hypothetical protein
LSDELGSRLGHTQTPNEQALHAKIGAVLLLPPYKKKWKEGRYYLAQYRYGNMNKMYHKQYLETLQATCLHLTAARRTSSFPHSLAPSCGQP